MSSVTREYRSNIFTAGSGRLPSLHSEIRSGVSSPPLMSSRTYGSAPLVNTGRVQTDSVTPSTISRKFLRSFTVKEELPKNLRRGWVWVVSIGENVYYFELSHDL